MPISRLSRVVLVNIPSPPCSFSISLSLSSHSIAGIVVQGEQSDVAPSMRTANGRRAGPSLTFTQICEGPNMRRPKYAEAQIWECPNMRRPKMPKCQNAQNANMPTCQNVKMSKCPNAKMPKCQNVLSHLGMLYVNYSYIS